MKVCMFQHVPKCFSVVGGKKPKRHWQSVNTISFSTWSVWLSSASWHRSVLQNKGISMISTYFDAEDLKSILKKAVGISRIRDTGMMFVSDFESRDSTDFESSDDLSFVIDLSLICHEYVWFPRSTEVGTANFKLGDEMMVAEILSTAWAAKVFVVSVVSLSQIFHVSEKINSEYIIYRC